MRAPEPFSLLNDQAAICHSTQPAQGMGPVDSGFVVELSESRCGETTRAFKKAPRMRREFKFLIGVAGVLHVGDKILHLLPQIVDRVGQDNDVVQMSIERKGMLL